jgi:tetratricopeptide (TPR) repeat protein
MLKSTKLIFAVFLLIGWAQAGIAFAAAVSNIEADFADLVVLADAKLDLHERQNAEQYLTQANQLLNQNPGISVFLKGHFNKVYGKIYMEQNATTALQYFNTALTQFSGNSLEQAETKMFIGITYYHAGNYTVAESYFEEAKTVFSAQGDLQKSAQVLNNLGLIYFKRGDTANAETFCERSLNINNEIGNRINASRNQQNLSFFDGVLTSDFHRPSIADWFAQMGGTGTGSGTITTSGSGTVVVTPPTGG